MPNLLQKGLAAANKVLQGAVRLKDPTNLDSQIERSDMMKPDSEPAIGLKKELIDLGEKRFEEARVGRWSQNAEAFSGIAQFQGRQWDYWDADADGGGFVPIPGCSGKNPDEAERMARSTWNITRVLVERMVARVTAAYPDAWPAPQTSSDEDKQAAQIARACCAHAARLVKLQELIEEAVLACGISTTCFIELGWDSKAWADAGFQQADGTIAYEKEQIGEPCANLMLCIDAYPDPNAVLQNGDIHSGAYFIKRCTRTLDFIQRKWGKTVESTGVSSTYGFLQQRLEWMAGDHNRSMAKVEFCTDVTEVWEKPSENYPNGRFWAYSADKTLLWSGPWPYKKKDKYPFVPIRYQKNQASIWGLNMTKPLRDVQIDLNELATYLRCCLRWNRPERYIPENCNVSPDDFVSPVFGKNVVYLPESMGGELPSWQMPPPPGPWLFNYKQELIATAEYIAGVRDFNSDTMPPPNSGFEFQLRVDQEKDRLGPVIRHTCNAVVEVYEWFCAFYEQFGSQYSRILGLDDKAAPSGQDSPAAQLVDMQALKNGNYRVILQPGSGQAKSPAAQEQRLDEIVTRLASPNMTPPLAEFYLNESQSIKSDAQADRLIAGLKTYFAETQQQALAVQAMKGQQAQQQGQQSAQQAAAQQAAETQADQEQAAIKVHAEGLIQQQRVEADQQTQAVEARNSMQLEQTKFEHALALVNAKQQTPSVSLSGTLGPVGIASAEEEAGLKPDDPTLMKKILMPAPPMANKPGGPKGATNAPSKK